MGCRGSDADLTLNESYISLITVSSYSGELNVLLALSTQGVSNELFQRRQSFTVFTEEAHKLSEGVMDAGTMQFKAKLCKLRERWNELFEKARMSESSAEQGLKPLNEYQEVFVEFTSRFEELAVKLSIQVPCFGSSEEVTALIEQDKVI